MNTTQTEHKIIEDLAFNCIAVATSKISLTYDMILINAGIVRV